MSRLSNALSMYFLLQVRNKMKVEELSAELEVSPRMIKQYKKDLEMAGIYIGSNLGRYGGYYLENTRSIDAIGFTDDEIKALRMAKETIKKGKYHYSSKFEVFASKILNSRKNMEEVYYYNKIMREPDYIVEKEKLVWIDINFAINKKRKVKMQYKSLKPHGLEIKERIVHPYGVFDYSGATYFYGYCESARDIRFFKLSRVEDYAIEDNRFNVKSDFDFNEVLEKSFGIYNDETMYVKLRVFYPMSEIVKEKQVAKKQKITEIDEKTIYFEAEMKGYEEIKSWILSMGSNVEVIEPDKLKKDILKEANELVSKYKEY